MPLGSSILQWIGSLREKTQDYWTKALAASESELAAEASRNVAGKKKHLWIVLSHRACLAKTYIHAFAISF